MADLSNILGGAISSATIETTLGPTLMVAPFAPSDGSPNLLLTLLKPKVTLQTALGTQVIAPYGEPGESWWPAVAVGLAFVGVFLLVHTYRGIRAA